MPYISNVKRFEVEAVLNPLLDAMLKNKDSLEDGDITYLITKIIVRYVKCKGKNYKSLKDVDGILGTTSKEFYRRITGPYEKKKQKENDPMNTVFQEIRDAFPMDEDEDR